MALLTQAWRGQNHTIEADAACPAVVRTMQRIYPPGEIDMTRWIQLLKRFLKDECGSDLIEYALVAAFLALSAVVAEGSLTNAIGNEFNMITNNF